MPDSSFPRHPIQVVVRRTGLSADLLRAWERRYRAVEPGRSETGRRLYSDDDIERLVLLRSVTAGGRPIRHVASLPLDDLRSLVKEDSQALVSHVPTPAPPVARGDAEAYLARGLRSVEEMNAPGLRAVLDEAALDLGRESLLSEVVAPLSQTIGSRWEDGQLLVSHEHLATAVIETFLADLLRVGGTANSAQLMVVSTPSGQRHQVGALLAASKAVARGWSVIYLGADTPASDLAAAVRQSGATMLALSIVYPSDDSLLPGELQTLRGLLPNDVSIAVGGRAAHGYLDTLKQIDATVFQDLDEFASGLSTL